MKRKDQSLRVTAPKSSKRRFDGLQALVLAAAFGAGLLTTGTARAQGSGSLATTVAAPTEASAKRFSFDSKLTVDTARVLSDNDGENFSGQYALNFVAADKETGVKAIFDLAYSREYSYQRDDGTDGDFENPSMALSKSFLNEKQFNSSIIDRVTWSVSGVLPGNRESRRRTFQGSIGTSLGVGKKFGKFSLGPSVSYTRGFYEFDIRDNGVVNSPDSYKTKLTMGYDFNDQWSISGLLGLGYAVSFQGVGRTTESTSLEVDYAPIELLAFALGVSNDRGTLDVDGQSNHVKFFDSETAQAFFDVTMSF